jgi:DNA-binding beta-propeller fold protein YncE
MGTTRIPRILLSAVLALVMTGGLCSGCNAAGGDGGGILGGPETQEHPREYEVAVIRTNDYAETSYIEYYDKDLSLVSTVTYPYACMENLVNDPSCFNGTVYVAHRGHLYGRGGGQALALATDTGKVTEYDIGQAAVCEVVATETDIFVTGGLGYDSFLTQIDQESGESFECVFEESFLHSFATDGTQVLVANQVPGKPDNELWVLNDTQNIKKLELDGLGDVGRISDAIDGRFYFAAQRLNESTETYRTTLNRYSSAEQTVQTVFETTYHISYLVEGEEYLFLMQDDISDNAGNNILVIDPATEKIVATHPLPFYPLYIGEKNGFLYLLSYHKNTGIECFYQYRIEGTELVESHRTEMNEAVSNNRQLNGTGFRASGMFFKE